MPDWRQYVRERLFLPELPRRREQQIVDDVARLLDQIHSEALAGGASEAEALEHARLHIPDWESFVCDVYRSERRHTRSRLEKWQEETNDNQKRSDGMISRWVSDLKHDLLYGFRMFRKNPGFTVVALLTLALGIGANTAMFSIVNGILLRPLPYPEPERLAMIFTGWANDPRLDVSEPEYFDFLDNLQSFESIGLIQSHSTNMAEGSGGPQLVQGYRVTPNVFELLKVPPALGRFFHPDEGVIGNDRVVLLSHELWQVRFGGDPNIVGRAIMSRSEGAQTGETHQIVGVMPEGFAFPTKETRYWVAYGMDRGSLTPRGNHQSDTIARLKAGVSLQQAQAELDNLAAKVTKAYPSPYPPTSRFGFVADPYIDVLVGSVRPALLILLGAVGLVLLIASANVANLLLARITGRQKEMALRAALGASAGRIFRQMLTESFLLSVVGGVAALFVAELSCRALVVLQPADLPRVDEIRLDVTVLLFNTALIFFTSFAFGFLPALKGMRVNLQTGLKEGGHSPGGAGRTRIRAALVVSEVAFATVLLIGAGLLLRTVQSLLEADPGIRPESVVTARINLERLRYPTIEQQAEFYRRLLSDLQSQEGVVSVGGVSILPLSGSKGTWGIAAEGYSGTRPDLPPFTAIPFRRATPGYFRTMGIPLLQGRVFTMDDAVGSGNLVAMISKSGARMFWGNEDPIGKKIKPGGLNSRTPWLTIVGVVGDIQHFDMADETRPTWYLPFFLSPSTRLILVARTEGDPARAATLMRDTVQNLDPLQPIYNVTRMDQMVTSAMASERFNALVLSTFAVLALGLAAIGIYGVLAYTVSQRTHEIGIRMALGAQTQHVIKMVLKDGLLMVGLGSALGLAGSFALTRFLENFLFGVTTTDLPTYAGVTALLVGVAALACLIPARRASRVDPMVALRYE